MHSRKLTHLSLRPHRDLHDYAEGVLGHDLAAEEHRQANVVDQLVDEQSKWVHLQEFSGNPIGLYLAGLLCRIPRINLEPIEDQDVIHVLDPVLSSARPTELDVAVRGLLIHDDETGLGAGISEILRQIGCSLLTKLKLQLVIESKDKDQDVEDFMVCGLRPCAQLAVLTDTLR